MNFMVAITTPDPTDAAPQRGGAAALPQGCLFCDAPVTDRAMRFGAYGGTSLRTVR